MIKMSTKAGDVSNWWKTMKVILTHTHITLNFFQTGVTKG